MTLIYKILRAKEWAQLEKHGVFAGSADDVRDGFIHFSTAEQVRGTVEKHFSGNTSLVLLAVEAKTLGESLRWEVSRGGQKFPHLYGELPLALVKSSHEIRLSADGRHILPREIP
jgi:uncharacterized protein (DUF952 family)